MELSNTEIKIVVKNMAREMVKKATAKNTMQFKYGDKVTVDGKYEGVVQAVKDGHYEVRIFDGSRVVGDKVCWPKDVTARNAAKNAALREVAVTYSDGTTITTSMAAHLSDADIKNYFRVGQEFNLGSGGKDKMVKVKSVKILNAAAKNDKSFRAQMNDTDIIGWKSLLTSIKSGKTKASDYENGLSDEDAIKILEKKISQAR